MRLVMKPGQEYMVYGKKVRAGEEFDVPENEAEVWQKLGRAMKAGEEPPRRGPGRPPKNELGRYQRADMRAEDDE